MTKATRSNKSLHQGQANNIFARPNSKNFIKTLVYAGLSLLPFTQQAFAQAPVNTLPSGYQVVSGSVNFQKQPNTLNVTSLSNKAIVNYDSFSVGRNEVVNFHLPNSASAILNRVTGSQASEIYGHINSNGKVFLINPNGILFGPSAQVNVSSLIASTLSMSDQDF